ncbi:leucine-rich repeat protein [uncultured Brachyspira sp.]|uniref:leucine-rich repeat protein n=1 Tax=uncultured Brachyspira sp. TaxID=221953 RepID=UPI0026308270|nr:leucine-rich repeat protein [uncultured Brachyspira sp.]
MKKLIIIFISLAVYSCNYKPISSYCLCGPTSIENIAISSIGANSTEEEIKTALENNKNATGKNIIIITGHIDNNSSIFDNIKKAIQNETDIILDLSGSSFETSYTFTLEGTSALTTVLLPTIQQITADFFKDCTSLVNVQIPSTVVKINNTSFENCTSLKNVEYLGTSPNALTVSVFPSASPTDLYLPNVASNPNNNSWNNFLGVSWTSVHYGTSMTY